MTPPFQPRELLRVLTEHGVEFVVIGGFAAAAHGSPLLTRDVDVVPEGGVANLTRLSDALRALDARVRAEELDAPLPFAHNAASLQRLTVLNLETRFGWFDLCLRPAGGLQYAQWRARAQALDIGDGLVVVVADLGDVIASKEAAGRAKDRAALPILHELLRRQRGGS